MKHFILSSVLIFSFIFCGCGKDVFTGKREARGVWMSRFEYANLKNPDSAKQHIRTTFEKARAAKFNMIFFQVRGNGDAFYRSAYEPWSQLLTGTLGKDPGWDPLQFAIDEAHRLGLELHAWVNTFPIWRDSLPPAESTPRSPMLSHPEWIICDKNGKPMKLDPPNNNYVWVSPGNPAVRQHVINVVMDIAEHYDIDGIHFDYIRYPEGSPVWGYSHDSVSVARFASSEGNPNKLRWEDWQREQLTQFVTDMYNALNAQKPLVSMSASVIGKYSGSGWTAYNVVYQDPPRWMQLGKIDFIVPMVYFERAHPTHPFVPLITEWHDRGSYERGIYPGLAARLIDRFGFQEIEAQIKETRAKGLHGVVFYSASTLNSDWEILGRSEFPYWSLSPRMPWKDSVATFPPSNLMAEVQSDGVNLRWQAPTSDEPLTYVVYRSGKPQFSTDDAYNILVVTGQNQTHVQDHRAADENRGIVYYAVSAVDRLGNESKLSNVIEVNSAILSAGTR